MEEVLSTAELSQYIETISMTWNFLFMSVCWYFWNIFSKKYTDPCTYF